jgi:hypothetical protein
MCLSELRCLSRKEFTVMHSWNGLRLCVVIRLFTFKGVDTCWANENVTGLKVHLCF